MGRVRVRWIVLVAVVALVLAGWLGIRVYSRGDGPIVEIDTVRHRRPSRRHRERGPKPQPEAPVVEEETADEDVTADENLLYGARFFDDAVRYVWRGSDPIARLETLYLDHHVNADLGAVEVAGRQRLWLDLPKRMRTEVTLPEGVVTTRIVDGEAGWLIPPSGRVRNLAITPEGRDAIGDLQRAREEAAWLGRVLTLATLRGKGVTFRFVAYTKGTGTYEGNWIKVTRHAPAGPAYTFWLAWTRDAQNDVVATWPGIVRVEGGGPGAAAVDYILRDWEDAGERPRRAHRFPRRIEAFARTRGESDDRAPVRTMFGILDDLEVNAEIPLSRFTPPR